MSTLARRFLKNLEARGLKIEHRGGESLVLLGPDKEKTPDIIAACKKFKSELLELYSPRVQDAAEQADSPANTVVVHQHDPNSDDESTTCKRCNAAVYDTAAAGAICDNVLSCPYRPRGDHS